MKLKLGQDEKLRKIIAKKGVMTAQELVVLLGNKMQLKRKADEGLLLPLGSGFYGSPGLDPFTASVKAAGRYYPQSVISGLTALVIHGLSDESLDRVDVDVPRGTSIKNRLLKVHRVSVKKLIGIVKLDFNDQMIRIYDPERSLCEAYRLDPSGTIFYKALKRYVKKYPHKPEQIAKYDQTLKTDVLRRFQQELADV